MDDIDIYKLLIIFKEKLEESQVDIPPDIAKIINEDFISLLDTEDGDINDKSK